MLGQSIPNLSTSASTAFAAPSDDCNIESQIDSATKSKCNSKPSPNNVSRFLSVSMTETYMKCNPDMKVVERPPQRVLTAPADPYPDASSFDNKDANLIVRVQDRIQDAEGEEYVVVDALGTGTFGQVFRVMRLRDTQYFAIKIVKNKPAYKNQGLLEVKIATVLNKQFDTDDNKCIVRLLDSFIFKNHVCLMFELLGISMLDVLTQNQYRGLPLPMVQRYAQQLITAFQVLEEAKMVHCDLKPENILLVPPAEGEEEAARAQAGSSSGSSSVQRAKLVANTRIKLIDLGSACFEGKTMYSYIQSRFYRSPEVLLGFPYNKAIDMWSLGCVCTEAFLGLPLFPGVSAHNQLTRIVDMFGPPPDYLVELGKHGKNYFIKANSGQALAMNGGVGGRYPACSGGAIPGAPYTSEASQYLASYTPTKTPSTENCTPVPVDSAARIASSSSPLSGAEVGNRGRSATYSSSGSSSKAMGGSLNMKGMFKSLKSAMFPNPTKPKGKGEAGYGTDALQPKPLQSVPETVGRPAAHAPRFSYVIKSAEQYAADTRTEAPVLKKYLRYQFLDDVVMKCPVANKAGMNAEAKAAEVELRKCFLDFLYGLFNMDPRKRWTPSQAAGHPFITMEPFTERYVPAPAVKTEKSTIADTSLLGFPPTLAAAQTLLPLEPKTSPTTASPSSSSSSADGSTGAAVGLSIKITNSSDLEDSAPIVPVDKAVSPSPKNTVAVGGKSAVPAAAASSNSNSSGDSLHVPYVAPTTNAAQPGSIPSTLVVSSCISKEKEAPQAAMGNVSRQQEDEDALKRSVSLQHSVSMNMSTSLHQGQGQGMYFTPQKQGSASQLPQLQEQTVGNAPLQHSSSLGSNSYAYGAGSLTGERQGHFGAGWQYDNRMPVADMGQALGKHRKDANEAVNTPSAASYNQGTISGNSSRSTSYDATHSYGGGGGNRSRGNSSDDGGMMFGMSPPGSSSGASLMGHYHGGGGSSPPLAMLYSSTATGTSATTSVSSSASVSTFLQDPSNNMGAAMSYGGMGGINSNDHRDRARFSPLHSAVQRRPSGGGPSAIAALVQQQQQQQQLHSAENSPVRTGCLTDSTNKERAAAAVDGKVLQFPAPGEADGVALPYPDDVQPPAVTSFAEPPK